MRSFSVLPPFKFNCKVFIKTMDFLKNRDIMDMLRQLHLPEVRRLTMNNKFLFRVTAAALALLFVLALAVPVRFAAKAETVEPYWTVPSGYNAHDYNAVVSFLEQTNAAGKKNGEIINASYDPNDPSTWGGYRFTFESVSGEKRLTAMDLSNANTLFGSLDLSNCTALTSCMIYTNQITELNVTGCAELFTLYCYNNRLSSVDVSTNTKLSYFTCQNNRLTEIDVSHNPNLVIFNCGYNNISEVDVSIHSSLQTLNVSHTLVTSVDVSHNPQLKNFYCKDNDVTELDLSSNSQLVINGVYAVGSGTVGTELINTARSYTVYAVPSDGAEFLGWYDENDNLVSDSASYRFYSGTVNVLYAHFEDSVLIGDVNFDGKVDSTDALLIMRHSMNITDFTAKQLKAGDLNGDGLVNATDALLVMRIAIGS